VQEDAYELTKKFLVIKNPPSADFTLATTVEIDPVNNTSLDGLYKSSGNFCTQCEAEGFRNITYYPDRPDVMTTFTTRITGDKVTMRRHSRAHPQLHPHPHTHTHPHTDPLYAPFSQQTSVQDKVYC
jgi:hypothetical protein